MSSGKGASKDRKQTSPLLSLVSGGTAGSVEAAVTYPFEFAKTRVQLSNERGPKNPFKVVTDVARQEGVRALWRGASTMIVGSFAKDSLRFLTFDLIKSAFEDPQTHTLTPIRSLLSGMSAGVVASTFSVTPTERIKTALIDDARNPASARKFTGPVQATKLILREGGIRGLWSGYAATTMKQAGATSVRLGSYNMLKDWEKQQGWEQSTAINFFNGAVAGTTTTLLTQPVDTLKTRAQGVRGSRIGEAVREIWAADGLRGFWRGTVMRLGRTVLAGGVLFTTNEAVADLLRPIFSGKADGHD